MPIGMHYFIRVYDDTVTERSVTDGDDPEDDCGLGALAQSRHRRRLRALHRHALRPVRHLFGDDLARHPGAHLSMHVGRLGGLVTKSVLRTPEFLADKRRLQGPYTFGAQMLFNPRADTAQGFRSEWLRYWPNENTEGLNLYLLVDPASGKKAKQRKNDFTTMLVLGIGGDDNYYLIDGVRDRLNLSERAKWLFMLHRRWRPRSVGYEEYGLQADIEHMQHVMGEQNYRFTITPLGGQIPKTDRIKRLIPVFEQGRMFLPQRGIVSDAPRALQTDLVRAFVTEEYEAFPVAAHDDMLDCMARILDPELGIIKPQPDEDETPQWMRDLEEDESANSFTTA
jgi:phage terminase large subunit-like protein